MNFKKITSSFLFILCCYFASAQCPSCTPAFVGCKAAGGLCGSTPVGMANKPYTGNLNFYMPKKLSDPTTLAQCSGCSYVNLRHIKITGVGGLPVGMSYLFNKPNANYKGYYDVQNNDTLGCATFCGTPILAGVYPIKVFLLADVTAIGTPIGNVDRDDQSQVYLDTLIILPDTSGGLSSFTYGNIGKNSCDTLKLPFNALLAAQTPNRTTYDWDFGGLSTSTLKNPGTITFANPGVYNVVLKTSFYKYRVKQIHLNSVTGGYYPDIEEPTNLSNPDPYISIPGLGYTSATRNDTKNNADWNNINKDISVGSTSISLTVWDEDTRTPIIGTQDDNLGLFNVNVQLGSVNFANGNLNGYVVFDDTVSNVFIDTLKVEIYGFPATPTIVTLRDSVCEGDSLLLNVNPSYTNPAFAWYKNDTTVLVGADSAYYQAKEEAKYKVIVTDNNTGCSSTSLNKKVFFGVQAPAQVFIYFDQGTQKYFLNPFPVGFKSKWFFDGNEVQGQTGQLLPDLGPGIYGAYVYNPSFAFCGVNAANDTVTVNGIFDSKTTEINNFSLYPNPNKGKFTVKGYTANDGEVSLQVSDMIGRQIMQKMITPVNGELKETLDLSDANKGVYFVTLQSKTEKTNAKVVIE